MLIEGDSIRYRCFVGTFGGYYVYSLNGGLCLASSWLLGVLHLAGQTKQALLALALRYKAS